jgi:hypothetical protein
MTDNRNDVFIATEYDGSRWVPLANYDALRADLVAARDAAEAGTRFALAATNELAQLREELAAAKWDAEESMRQYDHQQERACNAEAELATMTAYADKLADGLPEGMLPKDVENMRQATYKLAAELATANTRLAAAEEVCGLVLISFDASEMFPDLNRALEAWVKAKGGKK